MYAYPGLAPVISFKAMIQIAKHFQITCPQGKLALWLMGEKMQVNVLPNGFVELDGVVETLAVEREIDEAIKHYGAILELTNERITPYRVYPDPIRRFDAVNHLEGS